LRTLSALLIMVLAGCAVSKDPLRPTARNLQKGRLRDDSSFVYALPYQTGKSHLVVQGYFSSFSHRNRAAIDFKMKQGTTITAARDGVVVRLEKNQSKGGLKRGYRKYANYVVVKHDDGTKAGYWHLQNGGVLVAVGDTVRQGQPIGKSGKTGYSAFPHLHFFVWSEKDSNSVQLPTRFETKRGPHYLRPFRRYKSRPAERIDK
jgi:murein DD-endopeptidase MepM/ murein hydrolase activator NlpD